VGVCVSGFWGMGGGGVRFGRVCRVGQVGAGAVFCWVLVSDPMHSPHTVTEPFCVRTSPPLFISRPCQYSIDLYNEMNPSSNDPAYLHSVSSAVYASLSAADEDAIWVMQVCCVG
jgi:hypothetical protein